MPTPAAIRPYPPEPRGFGPFPDEELEAHIRDCGRLMEAAMDRYAESSDLADLGDAHRWRLAMEQAINGRSAEWVRRVEIERGLV